MIDKAWEIQRILQKVMLEDFSERIKVWPESSFEKSPFSTIAATVNMLIDELESRKIDVDKKQAALEQKIQIHLNS